MDTKDEKIEKLKKDKTVPELVEKAYNMGLGKISTLMGMSETALATAIVENEEASKTPPKTPRRPATPKVTAPAEIVDVEVKPVKGRTPSVPAKPAEPEAPPEKEGFWKGFRRGRERAREMFDKEN